MYLPFLKFDELHLFEPHPELMAAPSYYSTMYNITFSQKLTTVGMRDETDVISFLRKHVTVDDFVVLKYDVDEVVEGLTMEWVFLADLMQSEELALVDELFIELHFKYDSIDWDFGRHSMQQAFDIQRQLRQCGLAIHAWP